LVRMFGMELKKLGGKAFELYGKVSGKLGPIGMIGLSMAMPYLNAGLYRSSRWTMDKLWC